MERREGKGGRKKGKWGGRECELSRLITLAAWVYTGLLAGVAVASFSKTLTALFGLLIFGIQVCVFYSPKVNKRHLFRIRGGYEKEIHRC